MNNLLISLEKRSGYVFFAIAFLYFIVAYLSDIFILTPEFYYEDFGKVYSGSNLNKVVLKTKDFSSLKIVLFTFTPFINIVFVVLTLNLALLVSSKDVPLSRIFQIVTICYLIFLFPLVVKFFWFLTLNGNFTLREYNQFIFGGAGMFMEISADLPYWVRVFTESITLFEIAFWILLAFGVRYLTDFDFDKSTNIVLLGYVLGLVIYNLVKIYIVLMIFE